MTFTWADFRRVLWTAIQAFVVTFAAFASGWSQFPNATDAKAATWAGLVAAGAAIFSFIKNLVLPDTSVVK